MVRGRSVSGVRWAGGVRGIQHPRRRPEGQPEPFSLPLPPLPAAMLPDANKEEILIPQIAAFMRLGRRTGRRAQVRSGVRARPRARAPGCLPARSPHHLPCSAFLKCVRRAGVVGGWGRGRAWHLSPCHLPLPLSKETWCSLGREGWPSSSTAQGPPSSPGEGRPSLPELPPQYFRAWRTPKHPGNRLRAPAPSSVMDSHEWHPFRSLTGLLGAHESADPTGLRALPSNNRLSLAVHTIIK